MSRTFQMTGPMNDFPLSRPDGVRHRSEPSVKPKEIKPLLTREPLPPANDREKKQATQPKKRKRPVPTKPLLTFNPKASTIPSGRQDPPISPPVFTGPSVSESSTSSFDELLTASLSDHEIPDQPFDPYDVYKRPRMLGQRPPTDFLTSPNPATSNIDPNESGSAPLEFYDSPVSYTSSSSPAPSDQSPCVPEFVAPPVHIVDGSRQGQGSLPYPHGSHVYVQQQPAIQPDHYDYPTDPCHDRSTQSYPMQYIPTAYGRVYPDSNGYPHRYPN